MGKKRILIIDDNPFMVEILAGKLKEAGFDVTPSSNAKDGIDKIGKDKLSLVVLDVPLQDDIDGLKTLKRIRELKKVKELPIMVMAGEDTPEYQTKIISFGINGYIIKSLSDTEEIIGVIKGIVEKNLPAVAAPIINEAVAGKKEDGKVTYQSPFAKSGIDSGVPPQLKTKIEKALVSPREEISIISLVNDMIEYAYHARASDIHLEPYSDRLIIRMRIDGILYDVFTFPKNVHSEVVARIKVLSGMRTDEHQAAQDGRFKATIKNPPRQFDIRVSIVPTYYGENGVLRLLAEQTTIQTIGDLAFTEKDREKIKNAIKKPYGMILATGPTGSGKSTTLYTIIRELNTRDTSIITIEDPVEYSIEGIDQIQVNARTGLTFATGLRAILRQDPNVIMVGEIRDKETASIAVNAALTGHKLLSTLHTNDAATTLPRLLDMEIEAFLIASTVNIIIGQRLVRMLCQNCKIKKKLSEAEFKTLAESIPPEILGNNREFYEAKGCNKCGDTGYFDRMGIYEILEVSEPIREALLKRSDSSDIKAIAVKEGMATLLEDGFKKVLSGLTTLEEILRVVKE